MTKNFLYALGAASALALSAGAASAASLLTITDVTGSWTSATPAGLATLEGIGTNELRWGTPHTDQSTPRKKSGYDFVGEAPPEFGADPETAFDLGTFTHHNYAINEGTSITGATLNVTFSFYLGDDEDAVITRTSQFYFDHWETPNNDNPCANGGWNNVPGGVNANGCADRVMVSTIAEYTETFTMIVDGVEREYVFAVSGFDTGEEFWTKENKSNSATLKAYYTYAENIIPPAPVPLPAAGWLLMGGIGALGLARRRRKAA